MKRCSTKSSFFAFAPKRPLPPRPCLSKRNRRAFDVTGVCDVIATSSSANQIFDFQFDSRINDFRFRLSPKFFLTSFKFVNDNLPRSKSLFVRQNRFEFADEFQNRFEFVNDFLTFESRQGDEAANRESPAPEYRKNAERPTTFSRSFKNPASVLSAGAPRHDFCFAQASRNFPSATLSLRQASANCESAE
jgi:hypothetical protein